MLICYHGHAEFLLQSAQGLRLLTDPFPQKMPFPYFRVDAQALTSSHDHWDHCAFDKVPGDPAIVRGEGIHHPAPGLRIVGYPSFHDDQGGTQRGPNTIFLIEMDGLRLVHLGDLGAVPAKEVLQGIANADVLFVPVGGTYTLDAAQAADLVRLINPRITIPMHYKHPEGGFDSISPADAFVDAMAPLRASHQPLLRVTKEDISEAPALVMLALSRYGAQALPAR